MPAAKLVCSAEFLPRFPPFPALAQPVACFQEAGTNAHNHSSEPGAVTAAKIVKLVKEKALEDKFKPASAIVEEVFKLHLTYLQVNLANWRLRL